MAKNSYSEKDADLMNGIFKLLKNNSGRYYKSAELQSITGATDVKVRSAIHNIREEGYPITSGNNGYKWAENAEEVDHALAHMYARVRGIVKASEGLIRSKERYFSGQKELGFDEVKNLGKIIDRFIHTFKHQK